MQSCMVCITCIVTILSLPNHIEMEGYEEVHTRTHVSFSIADVVDWFRQLKMLFFQE